MLESRDGSSDRSGPVPSTKGQTVDVGLVVASIVAGMFLPVVSAFAVPSGLINLLWGSVYGLGFASLNETIGLHKGGVLGLFYGLTGFVLWPAIVAYVLGSALRTVRRHMGHNVRLGCRLLVLLSLLVAIPIPNVQGSAFERLPLFTKYIDF